MAHGERWPLYSTQMLGWNPATMAAFSKASCPRSPKTHKNMQRFQFDADSMLTVFTNLVMSLKILHYIICLCRLARHSISGSHNFFGHQSQRRWMHWKASLLLHASRWPKRFQRIGLAFDPQALSPVET